MPKPQNRDEVFDGQTRWLGGVNMIDPTRYQCLEALNMTFRNGWPETRGGIRRAFVTSGYKSSFYFNEDNARHNDATHTGFWFPFQFAETIWGSVQGVGQIRLSTDDHDSVLIVKDGIVYKNDYGVVEEIAVSETLGSDEEITFTQANDYVFMWRGESDEPLQWNGTDTGFVSVPAPDTGDVIPNSRGAVYAAGRLWAHRNRSTIGASDILDFNDWDLVYGTFSITPGDGDEIMQVLPHNDDKIIVFKRKSVSALVNISAQNLGSSLTRLTVDRNRGSVGRNGAIAHGEQVSYLGYGGIYSLQRNNENYLQGIDRPLSWPIQPLIDRINWTSETALNGVAAIEYDNYLVWAVPIDGSDTNNAMIVYDMLAMDPDSGEQGAWVGLWQSGQTNVQKFLKMGSKLYFVGYDGLIREMFTGDPWDSEDAIGDCPQYDGSSLYLPGEMVRYETGETAVYEALDYTKGNLPTDTDYWTQHTETSTVFDIDSYIVTRQYRHEDPSNKRMGRGEVILEHWDSKISITMLGSDFREEHALFTDTEFTPTSYDIVKDDWDDENANLDHDDAFRQDYATAIPDSGNFYLSSAGIQLNMYAEHPFRFLRRLTMDRSFALKIRNTRGKIRIKSVAVAAQLRRHAVRSV